MGEAFLRERVKELPGQGKQWRIESAGVNAPEGNPPSRYSEVVLAERGIDISSHRSRSVTESMLREFGLVLAMEKIQKQVLRLRFPEYADKVFMLSEMIGQDFDVDDPFGATVEDYRHTADVIERLIAGRMQNILLRSESRI